MRVGLASQWGFTSSDEYWPPELLQLVSISVCAWAIGAAEIITATASVKVATGMALKTRLFMFLHRPAWVPRQFLQAVALAELIAAVYRLCARPRSGAADVCDALEADDDLSLGVALLEVGEGVRELLEREHPIGHRFQLTAIHQLGQHLEVVSTGMHEERPIADPAAPGLVAECGVFLPHPR